MHAHTPPYTKQTPTGAYRSTEADPLGDAIASLGVIADQVETLRREFEALRSRGFGLAQKAALHDIRKTVPKWSPEWAKDLRDYGTTVTRVSFKDGEVVDEHIPMEDFLPRHGYSEGSLQSGHPASVQNQHPMAAEALRAQDEKPGDRL